MTSDELKAKRELMSLTQEQAGKAMGMRHRAAYGLIETRRKPTMIHAASMCMLEFINDHGLLKKYLKHVGAIVFVLVLSVKW